MSDYRYSIDADGVIRRGEIQRYGDDDTWRNYWDGDQMIAFTVDWHYGREHVTLVTQGNDVAYIGERIIEAWQQAKDRDRYLTLTAKALGANDFIIVHLDRGTDMHALYYGDDEGKKVWRDEIEAVYNHEVYRIVVDRQIGTVNGYDPLWLEDESDCEEYYGEGSTTEELARQFDLDEYPAEAHVSVAGA